MLAQDLELLMRPEPLAIEEFEGEYRWSCPECGQENLDDFVETAFPVCSECEESYGWDDLLSIEEMAYANDLKARADAWWAEHHQFD